MSDSEENNSYLHDVIMEGIYEGEVDLGYLKSAIEDCNQDELDERFTGGKSALHLCCEYRFSQAALMLIEAGASVDIIDDNGYGLLLLAYVNNMHEVMLALIKRNAPYDPLIHDDTSEEVQKALSFNYPECPWKFDLTLNDVYLLNDLKKQEIATIMLTRNVKDNMLQALPIEILQSIFNYAI